MKKHQFKITIDASREKVWNVLWNDYTYREWTSVFGEGSRAETDWKEGSKVLFLGDKNEGMVSTIVKTTPFEFMSFKHLGCLKNGIEDLQNEWSGALENYTLTTLNGKTEVIVDMDITEDFKSYFLSTWPKALEKVKELAEMN